VYTFTKRTALARGVPAFSSWVSVTLNFHLSYDLDLDKTKMNVTHLSQKSFCSKVTLREHIMPTDL